MKIDTIVFFGCSFTRGDDNTAPSRGDAGDATGYPTGTVPNNFFDPYYSYPSYVGRKLENKFEIENLAKPGNSNWDIYLDLIKYIEENQDLKKKLFVINVTRRDRMITGCVDNRFEYTKIFNDSDMKYPYSTINFYSVMEKYQKSKKQYNDDLENIINYLISEKDFITEIHASICLRAIKQLLDSKNLKNVFFNQLDANINRFTTSLWKNTKKELIEFDGVCIWNELLILSIEGRNHVKSLYTDHPNKHGYELIADAVLPKIKDKLEFND